MTILFFKNIGNLTKIGVYTSTLKSEVKKIKILNYCCLVCSVNVSFFFIVEIILSQITLQSFLLYLFQLITFLLIFVFQKKQKYTTARFLFLIFSFFILFYNANFAYQGFYGEYMYVLLPLSALFFFDKQWFHILVLTLSILLFYIPNYYLAIYPEKYFGYLNGLFLFLGTFFTVYYFKSQNKKSENSLEEAYYKLEEQKKGELAHLQLKSLKAQMNPHFMFNAMNSIQSLVLKGDKYEAYNYLTKFASLIRENLNMSEKSFIEFHEELSLLKKYLELEKLRFREDFDYEIICENEINNIRIPSMIIQPFIENAIKHGLLHKIEGLKKIKIEFYLERVLICIITDNGIGIEASEKINKENFTKEVSFSTNAIKDRLTLLKDYYKSDIGFEYEDVLEGTKVILKIPYNT